jgi:CRP-like cAMP-binding protein
MFKALETVPLFKGVNVQTLQLLASLFESFSCPAGTIIFEQGDPANYIYLLLGGSVEVRYKPYDGPPITITTLSKGHFFGWSAAIGNPTYTSGAVCKEDCTAIRMSKADLRSFCVREPEAGCVFLDLLAQSVSNRWQDAHSQIQSLLNSMLVTNGREIRPAQEKEEA